MLFFADFAFGMFTDDAEVIAIGSSIAFVIMPFYFLYVFLEVLASSIRGSGSTLPTMFIILVNMCVIRIGVLKLIMYFNPTADGVAGYTPLRGCLPLPACTGITEANAGTRLRFLPSLPFSL